MREGVAWRLRAPLQGLALPRAESHSALRVVEVRRFCRSRIVLCSLSGSLRMWRPLGSFGGVLGLDGFRAFLRGFLNELSSQRMVCERPTMASLFRLAGHAGFSKVRRRQHSKSRSRDRSQRGASAEIQLVRGHFVSA